MFSLVIEGTGNALMSYEVFQETVITVHKLCYIVRYIYLLHVSLLISTEAEQYNTLTENCRVFIHYVQYVQTIVGCHYLVRS